MLHRFFLLWDKHFHPTCHEQLWCEISLQTDLQSTSQSINSQQWSCWVQTDIHRIKWVPRFPKLWQTKECLRAIWRTTSRRKTSQSNQFQNLITPHHDEQALHWERKHQELSNQALCGSLCSRSAEVQPVTSELFFCKCRAIYSCYDAGRMDKHW